MHQIYDQIISLVKSNISNIKDNHIQFSDPNYKPFNFDKKNFKEIKYFLRRKMKTKFYKNNLSSSRIYCAVGRKSNDFPKFVHLSIIEIMVFKFLD